MTGPFEPKHFIVHGTNPSAERAAEIANAILAQKQACPEGGEHEPIESDVGDIEQNYYGQADCYKCGAKLRARWEAV